MGTGDRPLSFPRTLTLRRVGSPGALPVVGQRGQREDPERTRHEFGLPPEPVCHRVSCRGGQSHGLLQAGQFPSARAGACSAREMTPHRGCRWTRWPLLTEANRADQGTCRRGCYPPMDPSRPESRPTPKGPAVRGSGPTSSHGCPGPTSHHPLPHPQIHLEGSRGGSHRRD